MKAVPIPGVWDQHLRFDTELLNEEPRLREAIIAGRRVQAGFGYRVHVYLTDADARQLADHVEIAVELERQLAAGAGDGANRSLIASGPRLVERLRGRG